MTAIDKLREQRFLFLKRLYENTGGSKFNRVLMHDIGGALDFPKEVTSNICEYLVGEGLLEHASLGGGIAITHYGVVEIENALANPSVPTDYFPAVNIIHVENMHHSQIQQGSIASSQTMSISLDPNVVAEFVAQFQNDLPNLSLSDDAQSEAQAEIGTIDAQLSSPNPKHSIFVESLKSIKTILEGAAGNMLAQQLLNQLIAIGL